MKKKEVIIIGAGLAGMTAAIILAKKGYRAIIKESCGAIGGSPGLHPSVHTTPAQLDELWKYLGFRIDAGFVECDPYPALYLKKKKLSMPAYVKHNTAYCVERGPRPTSMDHVLFALAKKCGVKIDFGAKVDFGKLRENTIIATGLFTELYGHFSIEQRHVYGFWSTKDVADTGATGNIYMGPFADFYGYSARVHGLDYNLLFSGKPVTQKNLDSYRSVLSGMGMDDYEEPWRKVTMAIPAEARLFSRGMILAGTLSGMIEPFWGYGIVGALISGAIAAKAVTDRDGALRDFRAFTGGFAAKFARRERFAGKSYCTRSAMTRAGILAMRLRCALNREFASKSREPLRWFR